MHASSDQEFIEDSVAASRKLFRFKDVIQQSTGYEVIPAKEEYVPIVAEIKRTLKMDWKNLNERVRSRFTGRSNELGNFLDAELLKVLNSIPHFRASRPATSSGNQQAAGYPDILLLAHGKPLYIETKIYQPKTKTSTLRTFYFKPTEKENIKVNQSCPHILIGFEVKSLGKNNRSPFVVNDFTIVDLYDLKVNFKPEFNANNPMIYRDCSLL